MKKNEKTNVMRILEQNKLDFKSHSYANTEAISGVEVANVLGEAPEQVFKTLVTVAGSKINYVFMIPVDKELLDEEDRIYLTNIYNLINVRNKDIHSIRKLVGKSSGKKLGYIEIIFNSNVEDYGEERFLGPLFNPEKRFKELEDNKKYKIEDLGLWRK